MRTTRALILLIALVLSLAAPPAAARDGGPPSASPAATPAETLTQVIGDPVSVPAGSGIAFYEARVDCPLGQTPTGGGPKVSPSYNPLTTISSYADGRTWIVTATGGTPYDGTLWATAICSTEPHTQVFEGPHAVAARSEGSAEAKCPSGQYATGGGGRVDPGAIILQESFAGGDRTISSWIYYIVNPTEMTHYVESFVVCSPSPHNQYWSDRAPLPADHGTANHLESCPSGTVTGGGGGVIGGALYESSPWGNGWLASAVNETTGHPLLFTSAICKQ
ncbi:hypothetical protein ACIBCA_34285 [Kitasatospora sp. NPDC051170]|uniref:hypothetical protein n=1 Tax=Kitasatospora sp. NPDC051170 TaxID=3364056 RepID=UPI0037BC7BBC